MIEAAMTAAGFHHDLLSPQPGTWLSVDGIPVDLMVPEALAGPMAARRRGARIPPHDKAATRRAVGLEAAVVQNDTMTIEALDPTDRRRHDVRVASSAAILVAKLHKLGERALTPDRLRDKDAHDVYRLLQAVPTTELAAGLVQLLRDDLAGDVTRAALDCLGDLFASGSDAVGAELAGRAEEGLGVPETVAASVAILAADLIARVREDPGI